MKKKPTRHRTEELAELATEEETVRFNMNMPKSLHRELKMEAVRRECDMKDIVEMLLRKHLSI